MVNFLDVRFRIDLLTVWVYMQGFTIESIEIFRKKLKSTCNNSSLNNVGDENTASRVADHENLLAGPTERLFVEQTPAIHVEALLARPRERVLGRQTVVDAHNGNA